MTMTLYGGRTTRSDRCIWMLEELDQPYHLHVVDFRGGEHRSPDYLKLNPNGKVPTLIGSIEAKNMPEGAEVEVLIRPEALRLTRCKSENIECQVRVSVSRMLGYSSLIHLHVENSDGEKLHLHSRMPGRFLPEQNECIGLEIDPRQTFIFPRLN